ncbi:MAG TPA: preprotein translocase subunit SecE [Micromonosporaceae bacterium]
MAESKRRGEDAVEEHLDEVFDNAVDDDALDGDESGDVEPRATGRRGATATKARPRTGDEKTKPTKARPKAAERVGLFARLRRFILEVFAELRKVIWPTRNELLTYTTVVVIFVAVIMAIVALLDTGFAWAVLHVFGNGKK